MHDPRHRRRPALAGVITVGLLATALTATFGSGPAEAAAVGPGAHCADTSAVGGSILRCQVLQRAQYWVDHQVPYNSEGYYPDPQGKTYREDCSGYVSMAWHLSSSRVVSDPRPGSLVDGISTPMDVNNRAALLPGDAMMIMDHHTLLFDGWTDSSMTTYFAYEESDKNDVAHHRPVPYPYWASSLQGYERRPYRYNNITDSVSTSKVEMVAATGSSLYDTTGDYGAGYWSKWGDVSAATGGGGSATQIAAGMTGNTLHLYVANNDANHIWNTDGNFDKGAWSNWVDVVSATGSIGQISQLVAAQQGNKIHLVALVNGKILEATGDYGAGVWSKWGDITAANGGGSFTHIAAAVTDNTLHIYGVNADANHVWSADGNYTTGTWSGWMDVAGAAGPIGQVSQLVAAPQGNKIHLVALVNGKILEATGDYGAGVWSKWGDITAANGGGGFSQIAAAVTDNTLHIYGVNGDPNHLWSADGNYTTGTWSGWADVESSGAAGPIGTVIQLVATTR